MQNEFKSIIHKQARSTKHQQQHEFLFNWQPRTTKSTFFFFLVFQQILWWMNEWSHFYFFFLNDGRFKHWHAFCILHFDGPKKKAKKKKTKSEIDLNVHVNRLHCRFVYSKIATRNMRDMLQDLHTAKFQNQRTLSEIKYKMKPHELTIKYSTCGNGKLILLRFGFNWKEKKNGAGNFFKRIIIIIIIATSSKST